ncbi:MAG: RagB/SusD family nutrient uptake outer membrane protein [Bacteroidales bacterium]|nr:RagB/SusD family nutrient uptake outer membrane protein [Bacteroidales bacterium]MDD4669584.1 RagB/SusD family nutrient uptake outer membrane protein [Bacteroidales bacterium]
MKKINIILALICVFAFTACDSFLNVEPSNYADSSTSIKSAADAEVMINGLMRKMTSSSYYGREFLLYGDAKGGDLTIFTAGFGGNALYYFSHSQTSNAYSGFWSQIYHCLLQANNIIMNIEKLKAEGSQDNYDDFLGQALTARALMHFDLVRLYGKPYNMEKSSYGVPVVTAPVDASARLLRNSVEEVYTQIVADLNAAAPLLSKKVTNGYINYYANQALLSKVYLYMENYAGSLAAAKNVIDGGKYSLYAPSKWVASWQSQFGSESIFELGVFPNEGDLGTSSVGCYLRRKGHGSSSINGNFMASQYWLKIMGENDVRWGVMDWDQATDDKGNPNHKGACYKYSGSTSLSGDGKGSSTAVNIKVIRLSEVYLNAAEAALMSGAKAEAANYLNAISQRDPDMPAYTSSTVSVDAILLERRKELFCEGQLFHEMCRLNKTIQFDDDYFGNGTTSSYRETTIDRTFFRCRLPICQDEINANPEIENQQNPGY